MMAESLFSPPPVPQRHWGIRLDGCGPVLEQLIRDHIVTLTLSRPYSLIEIGSAGCVTLRAFHDILASIAPAQGFRAVGFDLTLDKAWSVNMDEVRASFAGLPECVITEDTADRWLSSMRNLEGMALVLSPDPRSYLTIGWPYSIDFAFIDGCHGMCAGRDFLAIEHKVAPGGVVVFHDYGEIEQGTDWQAHCCEFISVRSYVHRLGLAAPCVTPRKGWRFVGEIPGSRRNGGDGNSCAVVQRTQEPLESQPELAL